MKKNIFIATAIVSALAAWSSVATAAAPAPDTVTSVNVSAKVGVPTCDMVIKAEGSAIGSTIDFGTIRTEDVKNEASHLTKPLTVSWENCKDLNQGELGEHIEFHIHTSGDHEDGHVKSASGSNALLRVDFDGDKVEISNAPPVLNTGLITLDEDNIGSEFDIDLTIKKPTTGEVTTGETNWPVIFTTKYF